VLGVNVVISFEEDETVDDHKKRKEKRRKKLNRDFIFFF
jgi:hypothetical protein